MTWSIGPDAIDDLARGAAVLGTGGGGDPYIGALLARRAIAEHGEVTAVGLDELPDDALVITVAMMGAPTVMVEKLPTLESIIDPVRAIGAYLGRPVTHLACAEIGGVNSTIPIAAAAVLGLPLLDADGMGRAFPELQMVLPTLSGISASPLGFADEKGNVGVLQTIDNSWVERIARVAAVEMGCSVMICGFAMSGAQARESLVRDSLRRCIGLGSGIARARTDKLDPVTRVVELLGGRELFTGKVVDVQRATTAGFARGTATLQAVGAGDDRDLTLAFQNEHLIASLGDGVSGDEVLVTTPDLIVVLEHDTGEPITTEGLRYGQRVRVVAAPSDPRWHSPAALAMVGPGYFGYDVPARRFDGTTAEGVSVTGVPAVTA
ncbi:DUF917 domain-containing protein [Nakamurella flavida]|uniref:DUF917 domain-containing protein n=1 Tax=Nakamurella flavida TaxID=363630 RepID=A0A938YL42_9ACTN|nr:DUF917 domain-containing protein [Nakamurella flavida]MBM9476531.1 DUF917 domain-containing protein [Nakamurella flavida]MDP9779031.1 DUF917 family protein [Nakamurella flavida]